MGTSMYIVGAIIFGVYMYFTIMNIFWSSKKQREENYPSLRDQNDFIDYDGMGNFSRFPKELEPKRKRRKYNKTKIKEKV